MLFVPTASLTPGMKLANDVEIQEKTGEISILIRKNLTLEQSHIARLAALNLSGVYIDDGRTKKTAPKRVITETAKSEIVSKLTDVFSQCKENRQILDQEVVGDIHNIAEDLVSSLSRRQNLTVGIADLQSYDDATYHHSLSVAVISIAIGMEMGFDADILSALGTSALLHDVGKIDIPVEIINKPARLTADEFNIIKTHTLEGTKYLETNSELNRNIYNGMLMHHEKWDGTGYPNRLAGDKIPLFARIISVADVYDALTANRPYRTPMPPAEAVEYIMANAEISFDMDIIKAFLRKIEPYPTGYVVKLSDGRTAVVVAVHKENPLRPVVETVGEQTPQRLDLFADISLSNVVIMGVDFTFSTISAATPQ